MQLSKAFVRRWSTCEACPLHKHVRSYVIGRGDIPADVLLIGEAPGETEDILGKPFTGPAGKLLERMLEAADFNSQSRRVSRYYTNVVACCPWKSASRDEYREPNAKEAAACAERLNALVEVIKPKSVIFVGQVAKRYVKLPKGVPSVVITHPSAILRIPFSPENTVAYHQNIDVLKELVVCPSSRRPLNNSTF